MKAGFLQKLVEKLDRVDPGEVQNFVTRLLKEKGFLERVFDALQEGVIVLDAEGVITYLNRAACRLFGLNEEDAEGTALGTKIRGLEWEPLVREGGVISRDLEVYYPERRYLNFYLAPIVGKDPASDMLGHVMIVRDITRERQVEEEKIESERLSALTMLAAGVAHEIGNPLNSLNIHLQLARRKLEKAPREVREPIEELLAISQGEIKRLDFIVAQFLGAIRPHRPRLEVTDINDLVLEAVRFLETEMKDRSIRIEFDLSPAVPMMPLDRDQFKQAFYNLIKNASQAIGNEGTIRITTTADDYNVTIRFEDDGGGISAEDMSNIFEPYYTTKPSGTGLGLLIVRRIVREHGGEIEFESAVGDGTKVTVYLPRIEKRVRFLLSGDEGESGLEEETPGEKEVEVVKKKKGAKAKTVKWKVVEET